MKLKLVKDEEPKPLKMKDLKAGDFGVITDEKYAETIFKIILIENDLHAFSLNSNDHWTDVRNNHLAIEKLPKGTQLEIV